MEHMKCVLNTSILKKKSQMSNLALVTLGPDRANFWQEKILHDFVRKDCFTWQRVQKNKSFVGELRIWHSQALKVSMLLFRYGFCVWKNIDV